MKLAKHFCTLVAAPLIAGTALLTASAPAIAAPVDPNSDDALRPLIVRPADSAVNTAPAAPVAATPSAAEQAVTSSAAAPVAAVATTADAAAASDARLKLPAPPKPSQIDMSLPSPGARIPVPSPAGKDMFTNFGPPSGSVVSDRVIQLRDEAIGLRQAVDRDTDEFNQLRNKGAAGAIQFHSTVAAITARLEAGTTRGNPILLRQWSEAEQSLSEVHYSISKLNMLSTSLSSNSSQTAYLLQAIKAAFELSGALDEDHDQLAMIRDEVAKDTVNIDRLRGEINDDIRRQNTYLATERNNLQVLALAINRGELIRNSLAGQTVIVGNEPLYGSLPNTGIDESGFPSIREQSNSNDGVYNPPATPVEPVQQAPLSSRPKTNFPVKSSSASRTPATPVGALMGEDTGSLGQLLVLVRFNEQQVNYEDQMYQAVSTALDRKPDANFTIVAVAPKSSDPAAVAGDKERADRNAENVKSSLIQLGLEPSRISMSNTSSDVAQYPEVHLYIR